MGYSDHGYNLACILVLPAFQRKGYGNFIIQFSYELSKKEARVGSPEKPLSDLGKLSYMSYWIREILKVLRRNYNKQISLTEIAMCTSIKLEDIMTTLEYLQVLKYWSGQYLICVAPELLTKYLKEKKGRIIMNVEKIHWAPLEVEVKRDKWAFAGKKWELEDSSSKSHGHH